MRGLALAGLLVLACGSDDEGGGGGQTQNEPPALAGPASVALQQGRAATATLEVSDPNGDPVTVAVTPPAGIEASASGAELSLYPDYTVSGAQALALTLTDDKGASADASLAVDVAPLAWGTRKEWTTEGPEAREHPAVIVDEAGGRMVMVGGSGYNPYGTPLGDVWQYDLVGGTWTAVTPTGDVPPPAGSRRVAQIPGQSIAYLYGGYVENFALVDDVYRVDFSGGGVAFTKLAHAASPGLRALHGFAYDAETARFFTFAGIGLSGVQSDLWVGTLDADTFNWTNVTPSAGMSGRYGFFYGVDEINGRALVFSGAQGAGADLMPAQDTWALDMRADPPAWTLLLDGAAQGVPPGRRNGCAGWDPKGPRLFVFGGTADAQTTQPGLFALDARPGKEKWTELTLAGEPPLRSSGAAFHDPVGDQMLFGFGNTTSAVFRDLAPLGY